MVVPRVDHQQTEDQARHANVALGVFLAHADGGTNNIPEWVRSIFHLRGGSVSREGA
jgi:hypothetical protein